MQRNPPCKESKGEVRIIGGYCRGRKIIFQGSEGIRPTPNRIRETLFNWLAPSIQGASCLDLFAGSGALSFEALSRGARYCLALDHSREAIQSLFNNRALLGFSPQQNNRQLDILQASFPYAENLFKTHFDLVFLDPPFHQGYVPQVINWLQHCIGIKKSALLYVECADDEEELTLPSDWQMLKEKKAGKVRYALIQMGIQPHKLP